MAKVKIRSDKDLCEFFRKKFKVLDKQVEKLKLEWDACRDVYQGLVGANMNGTYDAQQAAQQYMSPQNAEGDGLPQINGMHLFTAQLFLQSKMSISEPAVTFRAYNQDHKNVQAAKAAQTVVNHIKKSKHLQEILESGPWLGVATIGVGVLYVGWDTEGGDAPADIPDNFNPETDTFKMEGDYDIRSIRAEDFLIDPDAKTFAEANYCVVKHTMDLQEAVYRWPDSETRLKEYAREEESLSSSGTKGEGSDEENTSLMIYEYWERGRPWNAFMGSHVFFICKNDPEILERKNNPYSHKKLPFLMLTDLDLDSSAYGISRAVHCIPMQEAQNTFFQLVQTGLELNSVPRMIAPEGSINDDVLSNNPANVLFYNAMSGEKPDFLRSPAVSPDIWQLNSAYEKQISSVYGMNEFSRGEINRELSSYAVQMSIEVDDKFRVRLFNKKKEFISEMYEMLISLTKQYITVERLLCVAGAENTANLEYFRAEHLEGKYGIFADFGVYLPADPAARKQQILELMKSGVFEKAGMDMKKMLSLLVDGDMLDVKDYFEISRRRQEEEIISLINSGVPDVQEWHDHTAHMVEVQEYTQTQEFELLDADVKKKIWDHWNAHKDALAKLQAAAQGGGEPGGEPGGAPGGKPGGAPAGGSGGGGNASGLPPPSAPSPSGPAPVSSGETQQPLPESLSGFTA